MIMRPIDDKKSIYFKAYLLSIKEIKKSIMFHCFMFLYKLKTLMKDSLSVSEVSPSEGDTFIPQIVINPSQTEQLGVSPHLHHLSSLQHKDPV